MVYAHDLSTQECEAGGLPRAQNQPEWLLKRRELNSSHNNHGLRQPYHQEQDHQIGDIYIPGWRATYFSCLFFLRWVLLWCPGLSQTSRLKQILPPGEARATVLRYPIGSKDTLKTSVVWRSFLEGSFWLQKWEEVRRRLQLGRRPSTWPLLRPLTTYVLTNLFLFLPDWTVDIAEYVPTGS